MSHKDKEKQKEYNRRYAYAAKPTDNERLYTQRYNYVMKESRRYKDIVKWWNERRESGELVIVDGKAMLRMNRK